jgi:hypothetical protein
VRHKVFSLILGFGFLAPAALPATAQQIPDMVGNWKGMLSAVHIGSNPYRVAQGNGVQFPPNEIEFTYAVKEQPGNRFAGESSGGNFKETIIGALKPDNKSGIMLDDDGRYDFTLVDANTMDVCYGHQFPTSRVVSCFRLTRSP